MGLGINSGGLWSGAGGLIDTLGGCAGPHTYSVSGPTKSVGQHLHSIVRSIIIDNFSIQSSGEHYHDILGKSGFSGEHFMLFAESFPSGGHSHEVYGETDWSSDNHSHEVISGNGTISIYIESILCIGIYY
eukprot:24370_1